MLTKEVPLTADAQARFRQVIETWKGRQNKLSADSASNEASLIGLLIRAIPEHLRPTDGDPEKVLRAIINSAPAQALGKLLQDSIDAVPTDTSIQEVLLSALLLDVDPAGGQQRNSLAGYALRQPDNWGRSPADIVKRFEAHLAVKFGEPQAKVIAFQLLSVSAPEFLVKDVPANLVYGSHQWAAFSAAVSRREANHPGASANRAYTEIMTVDETAPAGEAERRQQQFAQMTAVIDWGIANGVILESRDDAYTPEDIERAVEAMDAQYKALSDSVSALTTPMPTRRDLALDELRRVYGTEKEAFFEKKILTQSHPDSSRRKPYSLLDVYMSGELGNHAWFSSDPGFTTEQVNLGFQKLPDIKNRFDEAFAEYSAGLKSGLSAQFKYQLSLLPIEDRRLIEYGEVTTFCLRKPDGYQGPVSPEHKIHPYVNSGAILIRAELGGKTGHYLYSPAQGRIIKDADPSRPGLRFPGSRLYFSMALPDSPGGKEPPVTILWQEVGGRSPKNDPADFAAFSIYPSKSLEAGIPGPHTNPVATFFSDKTNELAAPVSAYFMRGMDEQKVVANGTTEQERETQRSNGVKAFFLGLIPFYSTVKSFIDGKPTEGFFNFVLDVFGFFVPALKGGVQAVKAVGKGGVGAALSFIKGFSKSGLKAANPLEGVFDAGRGVFQLGKQGFKKLRNLSGNRGKFVVPHTGKTEPIADGIYRPRGSHSEAVPTATVERNGKWYAFDNATQTPYGAPLSGDARSHGSALVKQVKQTALEVATQSAFSVAVSKVQEKLTKHYQRPTLTGPGFASGDVEVASTTPALKPLDPALLARLEAAARGTAEIEKLSLELTAVAPREGNRKWAGEPLEVLEQIETTLGEVEERTESIAEVYEVFFQPYRQGDASAVGEKSLAQRLDLVEKRIAAVRQALTLAQDTTQEASSGVV
ncbi:MAG: hypothetical protein ACRC1I_11600 [Pseudomonas proteolytica]|uniref:hypothetical protein n=1 Tax=Pseudomonas proteolytica TaxID=219574 RepID=UPI003F32356F